MTEEAFADLTQQGFAGFFHDQYETLLRAMYLITGNLYEAEDLAQDAFVKVCERWDRVSTMENPRGYLYRTAVNAHRSAIRRLGLLARRTVSTASTDPISDSDERDRIRRVLARLPANQREAIVLVEWLGFSDAEAGKALGTSAGAIRVRLSRARATLRPLAEGNES